MTGKKMTGLALGISALALLGLTGLAVANETTESLVVKLTAAISEASRANVPIIPAVSTTIEASGASPEVVTEALTRLLGECPAGELLAELRKLAPDQVPLWCSDDSIDGLRGLRAISLAQLEATGAATGATGATGNGGGLASPPASVGSANGASFSAEAAN